MPPRNPTLSECIDTYKQHRQSLGISPKVVENDMRLLRMLLAHTGNIRLRNLRERHIDAFFLDRQTKIQTSTWNQELSIAKTWANWCDRKRYWGPEGNPLINRRARKFVPRARLRIPAQEFPRLLDTAQDPLDRLVVALGIYMLLRQGEMKRIRVGHVNLETGYIAVAITKTGERDDMPISSELDQELRTWFTWYTQQLGRPLAADDHLMPVRARKVYGYTNPHPLDPTQPLRKPHHAIQRVLEACGYDTRDPDTGRSLGEGVHTLRRSAARALFDQHTSEGYDRALRHVQALLHHANSTMTERYLGIEVDKQKRDTIIRGKSMYHQADTSNVVQLHNHA